VENDTLEIRSLRNEFAPSFFIDDFCVREQVNLSFGKPYFIKKSTQYFTDLNYYINLNHWNNFEPKRRHVRSTQQKLTIELAVFFDEAAYRTFMPLLDNDNEKIRYMILMCVNGIQAAFHHPSLGVSIDISLVRLDIMEKQPLDLPVVDIDADEILDLFCNYTNALNPPDDDDPRHWDIALYLTGIDLYTNEEIRNGTYIKENAVIGVSSLDSACGPRSCTIVNFHVPEILLPVLRSSMTAVHEIGHL
jgi:hypothetical protein